MRVLLIEDNPDHAELVSDAVMAAFPNTTHIEWKDKLSEGIKQLEAERDSRGFDVFLCDLRVLDSDTKMTVKTLQSLKTSVPIIVLSSLTTSETASSLLNHGVQDCIQKEQINDLEYLQKIISFAIERKRWQWYSDERNRDMELFCHSLSHDFKSPIRTLTNMLELLKSNLDSRSVLDQEGELYFGYCTESIEVLNALISGLGDYLKTDLQSLYGPVDLLDVINDVIKMVSNDAKEANFQLNPPLLSSEKGLIIEGNRTKLVLMFKNLFENSVKYCECNPCVVIDIHLEEVTLSEESRATDQGANSSSYWVISIADNGIGIESNQLNKIFEPFSRLHNQQDYVGSGLGLSIVKKVVGQHQGSIDVKSHIGEGSQFILRFPG